MTVSIHIRVCTDQRMDGRPVDTRLATPHTRARPYGARAHEEYVGEPTGGGGAPEFYIRRERVVGGGRHWR